MEPCHSLSLGALGVRSGCLNVVRITRKLTGHWYFNWSSTDQLITHRPPIEVLVQFLDVDAIEFQCRDRTGTSRRRVPSAWLGPQVEVQCLCEFRVREWTQEDTNHGTQTH